MSALDTERTTAKAQAEAARARLSATLSELQTRLNPKALAREAVADLRESGEELARTSAAVVRRNATPIAGVAATLGLVLARHQLGGLFAHLTGRDETRSGAKSSKDDKAPRQQGKKHD